MKRIQNKEYNRQYLKKRRQQRFNDELCYDCDKPRLPDRVRCKVCCEIAVDNQMGRFYLKQLRAETNSR
jgi:hypothetical protein